MHIILRDLRVLYVPLQRELVPLAKVLDFCDQRYLGLLSHLES